jgi:F0F1-type ATP synthase epsilon subunit
MERAQPLVVAVVAGAAAAVVAAIDVLVCSWGFVAVVPGLVDILAVLAPLETDSETASSNSAISNLVLFAADSIL